MSDGEWQEGSNWEALIFATHQQLDRLTVLVDVNGLQGFGSTKEVASMSDLAHRIAAFGATVREIDGHQAQALQALLQTPQQGFQVILLNTVKGKGVSFMEAKMEWHYLPLTAEQFAQAQNEVRLT
jgi:transketolase